MIWVVSCLRAFPCSFRPAAGLARLALGVLALLFSIAPLAAQTTNAAPVAAPAPAGAPVSDFGQYLADHEADLTPFFTDHAGELGRDAVPLIMGMLGWVVLVTMLIGWVIDVLL